MKEWESVDPVVVHPDDEERAREVLAATDNKPAQPKQATPDLRWNLDPDRRGRVVKIVAVLVLIPILWGVVAGILELVRSL